MPTFKQAIDSEPKKFGEYGDELGEAKRKVDAYKDKYESRIDELESSWRGDDYDALTEVKKALASNLRDTAAKLESASTALDASGPVMVGLCNVLVQTKDALEQFGYEVHDPPFVWLGPRLQQQVSSTPPPGNAALFSAYSGVAVAQTAFLAAQYGLLVAQDATAAAALHTIGLLMKDIAPVLGGANQTAVRQRRKPVADDPAQRPGFNDDDVRAALDRTQKNAAGEPVDWRTGEVIDAGDRSTWDMGHPYGFESRKHEEAARLWQSKIEADPSLDMRHEVIARHREAEYIAETHATNRGHYGEAPDAVNYWIDVYTEKYGPPPTPVI